MQKEKEPVVVIGIDGATWKVLDRLISEGVVPNLAGLCNKGVYGDLMTPFPPGTSPGWPSFLTGKNPGKHGVFGFKDLVRKKYGPPIVDADCIKSKMFFEIASEAGKKVCICNFPLTYPLRRMDGVWVSGFLTPPKATDFYHPDSIIDELKDFTLEEIRPSGKITNKKALEFLDNLIPPLRKRAATFLKLAQKGGWDLFMCCFAETDRVHHFLWKYLDEATGGQPEDDAVRQKIYHVYKIIDECIGELIYCFGSKASFIVGSDHGFGLTGKKNLHLNLYLKKEGMLSSNLYSFSRLLYKNRILKLEKGESEFDSLKLSPVSWKNTKAWAISYNAGVGSVFINTKGRYPFGIVEPGTEYEKTVKEVCNLLEKVEDQGTRIIINIRLNKDIYDGPFTVLGPDINFDLADGYELPLSCRKDLKGKDLIDENHDYEIRSGAHRSNGVYIISGNNILEAGRLGDMIIEDIAPTALYMLGLSIPDDIDGSVAEHAFKAEYLSGHSAKYRKEDVYDGERSSLEINDDIMIKKQLEDLGYL